jgi:hypothetical protein
MSAVLVTIALAQNTPLQAMPDPALAPQQTTHVGVEPSVTIVENGETFRVYIVVKDADNLGGFQFVLDYDPAIVELPDPSYPMQQGPFPGSTGRTVTEWNNEADPTTGVITYVVWSEGSSDDGPDGNGVLAYVDLRARALGTTDLDLKQVELTKASGESLPASVGDGVVVVATAPIPAQVSIDKSADQPMVPPGGRLTYTLDRGLTFVGTGHTYDETIFDPIPPDTTYVAGSATLDGMSAPQLYSTTLDAIFYQASGNFADAHQWTISFQVEVGCVPIGARISNTATETVSLDGAAYSGPYTSTTAATVSPMPSPDLSTPSNGSTFTDTTPTFTWDDVSAATSYRIQVDDVSSFSSPEIDVNTTATSHTPDLVDELPTGSTYYWRVRASNSCGDGPWPTPWEFRIPQMGPVEYLVYLPTVIKNH